LLLYSWKKAKRKDELWAPTASHTAALLLSQFSTFPTRMGAQLKLEETFARPSPQTVRVVPAATTPNEQWAPHLAGRRLAEDAQKAR